MEDFNPYTWKGTFDWIQWNGASWILESPRGDSPANKNDFLCVFCISGFSLFENSVMTLHGADVLKGNDRPLKDRSQRHLVTIASINNTKSHCASMGQVCTGMEGQTAHGTMVQRFVNGET